MMRNEVRIGNPECLPAPDSRNFIVALNVKEMFTFEGGKSGLECWGGRCMYLGLCASFFTRTLACCTKNCKIHHFRCQKYGLEVYMF